MMFAYLSTGAAHFGEQQVVVVMSSDNSYFNETIDSLVEQVNHELRITLVGLDELKADFDYLGKDVVILALGNKAVKAVAARKPAAKTINAYLTLEQYRQSAKIENQISLLLDQPLQRYIDFGRLILPGYTFGLIQSSGRDIFRDYGEFRADTKQYINKYNCNTAPEMIPLLRELLKQNDALLMLPQQEVYQRKNLKAVLLTAYRSRKPVISYSPAHVISGALASIYSSPGDIGKHLALVVNRLHHDKPDLTGSYEFARYFSISMNRRVAHSLAIQLPEPIWIRRQIEKGEL